MAGEETKQRISGDFEMMHLIEWGPCRAYPWRLLRRVARLSPVNACIKSHIYMVLFLFIFLGVI
jgi:hypothetical protein